MSHQKSARFVPLASVALLLALSSVSAPSIARTTTFSGPNGGATHSVQRGNGSVSSQWTGNNGQTAGRTVNRSATGTSSTISGPGGNTATRNVERSSTGSTATVTGPQGQQMTRSTQP